MISTETIGTVRTTATHIAFKSILCATDFSEVAKKALAYAASIARTDGAKLQIVHVLPAEPPMPIPMEPLPAVLDRDRAGAEWNMRIFKEEKCLLGLLHEEIVERGPIEDVIADLIRRRDIDLLVLGTRARGGLNKFLLGSVAEELFRVATCPVLTVGPQVPELRENELRLGTVLFPIDFEPPSLTALPFAISIANTNASRLILMHVITPKPLPPHLSWEGVITVGEKRHLESLDATRRLSALIADDASTASDVQYLVLFGLAPRQIEDAMAKFRPDLVVMGVKKLAAPRASAHLRWSTAHHVVCRARCPVLTIRH
jgi:nucleotide-binding universal stress UspA family protein